MSLERGGNRTGEYIAGKCSRCNLWFADQKTSANLSAVRCTSKQTETSDTGV